MLQSDMALRKTTEQHHHKFDLVQQLAFNSEISHIHLVNTAN